MEQTFKITINAVSPDGESVKAHTDIHIHCEHSMAVGVVANLLRKEPRLKSILTEAFILAMSDAKISEEIDEDEFNSKDGKNDLEL